MYEDLVRTQKVAALMPRPCPPRPRACSGTWGTSPAPGWPCWTPCRGAAGCAAARRSGWYTPWARSCWSASSPRNPILSHRVPLPQPGPPSTHTLHTFQNLSLNVVHQAAFHWLTHSFKIWACLSLADTVSAVSWSPSSTFSQASTLDMLSSYMDHMIIRHKFSIKFCTKFKSVNGQSHVRVCLSNFLLISPYVPLQQTFKSFYYGWYFWFKYFIKYLNKCHYPLGCVDCESNSS